MTLLNKGKSSSATTWSGARQSDTPAVAPVAAAALPDVIKASRHDAKTLCIIDTAPHAAPDAARVAALADPVARPLSTWLPPAVPSRS
jgi:chromosome partitioning protein